MKKSETEQNLVILPGGGKCIIDWCQPMWLDGADATRPLRLEVTTPFLYPSATGMPEGRELHELDNLEHLLGGLVSRAKGQHAMTVTAARTRVWVYYMPLAAGLLRKQPARERLPPELARLAEKLGRELRVAWFDDAAWTRLLSVFSAHDPAQWIADRALLERMAKAGDAIHARRSVTHSISFATHDPCPEFLRDIRRQKLKADEGPKQTPDGRWLVRVARLEPTLATWHLHPVVLSVKAVAHKHGGRYEGWGTDFIQSLVPPPLAGPKGG